MSSARRAADPSAPIRSALLTTSTRGTAARLELEKETGERVYLDLFVKVEKDWSRNETKLRRLGYG